MADSKLASIVIKEEPKILDNCCEFNTQNIPKV